MSAAAPIITLHLLQHVNTLFSLFLNQSYGAEIHFSPQLLLDQLCSAMLMMITIFLIILYNGSFGIIDVYQSFIKSIFRHFCERMARRAVINHIFKVLH